ncbi:unnamed protein product, partial [Brachionus calyciflorus]
MHHFFCYAFSLLLNSKTLDDLKKYFRSIVIVSISQSKNSCMKSEFEKIHLATKERNNSELEKTIDKQSEITEDDIEKNEVVEFVSNTLKDKSPFTNIFMDILKTSKKTISELEATSEASIESNEFYDPDVAHFLQERFMP